MLWLLLLRPLLLLPLLVLQPPALPASWLLLLPHVVLLPVVLFVAAVSCVSCWLMSAMLTGSPMSWQH